MKIFITGSTGFIGENLLKKLAERGHIVHALFRDEKKIPGNYSGNITYFKGDITNEENLEMAMDGCDYIIHTAAFTGKWHKDQGEIMRLNVESTLKLVRIAMRLGIKRCLITSSAGVFGPSNGKIITETSPEPDRYFTPYELSKAIMEREVKELISSGTEVVFVNPTRVFGPGPFNDANSVTKIISQYRKGKWHIMPGDGGSIGNYVFIDDVAEGHILALEKGKNGERYLLGGENISYNAFFSILGEFSGKKQWMVRIPLPLMLLISRLMMFWSKLTGLPPAITTGLVRKYNHNWQSSSEKAINELGYRSISFREGVRKTLQWLENNDNK